MRRMILLTIVLMPLLFTSDGEVGATVVYVAEDYVELRAGKGGWSEAVATLNKGAALEVLEGEGDDETSFYGVRVASGELQDVEGYIEKSLVAREEPDEGSWGQMAGYFGGSGASAEGDVAGAKGGFGDQYAQDYGYDLQSVFAMDEAHKEISREDIHAFMREGGIGLYQPPPRRRGGGR